MPSAPGGAYKRFARRAKPWRRRNSVGAHLCVHPACSAGRRADEGIGPYGPCGIGSQYVHTWSGVRFLRRGQ